MNPHNNRVIAYIDGFNLYNGLKESHWRKYYWLDLVKLASDFLPSGCALAGVKYFTAIVQPDPNDPDNVARQKTYIDALRTLSGLEVFLGHYLPLTRSCHFCKRSWTTYEEKCTDVNIASHMLMDAFDTTYDYLMLFSGDGDLLQPLTFVRRRFTTRHIIVVFPPARTNKHLSLVAHTVLHISRANLIRCQLPNTVTAANGYVLSRPSTWS